MGWWDWKSKNVLAFWVRFRWFGEILRCHFQLWCMRQWKATTFQRCTCSRCFWSNDYRKRRTSRHSYRNRNYLSVPRSCVSQRRRLSLFFSVIAVYAYTWCWHAIAGDGAITAAYVRQLHALSSACL